MPVQLKIFPEKCSGCKSCELICSLMNVGEFNPSKSRIKTVIFRETDHRLPYNFPSSCKQCVDAPCIRVCSVDAITCSKGKMRIVKIDYGLCIKCGKCVEACPFGAMSFDGENKGPFKCELCEGEPACVSICPTEAIIFVNQRSFHATPQYLANKASVILSQQNRLDFRQTKRKK